MSEQILILPESKKHTYIHIQPLAMIHVWSGFVSAGIKTTKRMMDVIMVLHCVSVCSYARFTWNLTHMDPIAKMIVRPIFCFLGICKPQMVGIGIAMSITSVTTPMTAVAM